MSETNTFIFTNKVEKLTIKKVHTSMLYLEEIYSVIG